MAWFRSPRGSEPGVLNSTGASAIVDAAIDNAGTFEATAGTLTLNSDTVDNTGTLEANGGKLIIASNTDITGNMTVTIRGSGTPSLQGGSSIQSLDLNDTFSGAGTLQLDHSQFYDGTITGFSKGDVLDLINLAYSANEYAIWNDGTLTIYNGQTPEETIAMTGDYAPNNFAVIDDAGATEVAFQSVDKWTRISEGGKWNNASAWSAGVPTDTINAAIDGTGTYAVAISKIVEAKTLAIGDPNATLDGSGTLKTGLLYNEGIIQADGQTLTIGELAGANTSNPVTNMGTLEATDGGVLRINDSSIDNTGTGTHGIIVDGLLSEFLIGTGNLQLDGGGDVTLENGGLITVRK